VSIGIVRLSRLCVLIYNKDMAAMSIARIVKLPLSLVPRPSVRGTWYTHAREEGLVNIVHNPIFG